jgi:hypothetical protein
MRGGASLPRMMVERISTFEPGRSVGGFHQTLELGSIRVATFDEARRHFEEATVLQLPAQPKTPADACGCGQVGQGNSRGRRAT